MNDILYQIISTYIKEATSATEESLKAASEKSVREFKLEDVDQDKLFKTFKDTYEKKTGVAWDYNKFISRARNWSFYGNDDGFVAVRPQQSGFVKLVGSAGNIRSVYGGLKILTDTNKPLWGVVTDDIAQMLSRFGFKVMKGFFEGLVVKSMVRMIPMGGGQISGIGSDGAINLDYSDTGPSKKYFVGNKSYWKKLWSEASDKLPDITKKFFKSILGIHKEAQYIPVSTVLRNIVALMQSPNLWTAYHRTKNDPEKFTVNRFEPGPGKSYGRGFYGTFDLDSQLKGNMESYGPYIIKFAVRPVKFLIFDKDLMQKQYGTTDFSKQLDILKFPRHLKEKLLDLYKEDMRYTSDAADPIGIIQEIHKYIHGLQFTGRRDGKVVVVYDSSLVAPVSYSKDEGKTWISLVNRLKYPGRSLGEDVINPNVDLSKIKNPSERLQLEAIKEDVDAIRHIKNPSEAVQLAAVKKYDGEAIRHIKNPSEEVQLAAVKKDGEAIKHIKNPSEAVQIAAVEQSGYAIYNIIDKGIVPSEKVQLAAVKKDGEAIKHIKNPSEAVQIAAVEQSGYAIYHIIDKGIVPSEKVQLAAVKKDWHAIQYIKNPSEAAQLAAVEQNGGLLNI